MDEKTKARIKEHIDLHLNAAEAALKGFETAKTIVITDDAGFNVTIEKSEESIKRLRQTVAIYTQLKKDYDAGNFDTDTMVIVREIVSKELPKKRAIWQNKNTNQLAAAILAPTEITDKKKQVREPVTRYKLAPGIIYDGLQKLTPQTQVDIVRFADLWSEHWGKTKSVELRFLIKDVMAEWNLNSYSSFRRRLTNIAYAMSSLKHPEPGGGASVFFPRVFIEQNTGYFVIQANQSLIDDLETCSSPLLIDAAYWIINAHDFPYAPIILRKLTSQEQLNRKNNKPNVMRWRRLIEALPHLPQEKVIKEDQDRHYERIYEPLLNNINHLKERKLIDWHHIDTEPQNWQELKKGKFGWKLL